MNLLLARFPALRATLPFVPLGTYPTAIERLERLERAAGLPPGTELRVKRDDLSGEPWGTSKVRKLEHYFGEARARGVRRVATVGPLGSNHALATAIYGDRLGLEVLLELWPEPVTPKVRETLLVERALGARQVLLGTAGDEALAALAGEAGTGTDAGTYFIPPAGTDAVGATGYVECALEIAADPAGPFDFVHVAGGTGGVAAGLAVGFAIVGPSTRTRTRTTAGSPVVVAVRAVAREILSIPRLVLLARRIADRLAALAGAPVVAEPPGPRAFEILHAHAGGGYAVPTEDGARAAALARDAANLVMDTTYTAKALAGALAFARSPEGAGRRHLFLHTYGSRDLSALASRAHVEDLPAAIRALVEATPGP